MTLREMRETYPGLFYEQDWFDGHAFMNEDLPTYLWVSKPEIRHRWWRKPRGLAWRAVDIASIWVREGGVSDHPMWGRYLWTSSHDDLGQRIYVGQNGKGLEIHRHLHLTDRWGVPV